MPLHRPLPLGQHPANQRQPTLPKTLLVSSLPQHRLHLSVDAATVDASAARNGRSRLNSRTEPRLALTAVRHAAITLFLFFLLFPLHHPLRRFSFYDFLVAA